MGFYEKCGLLICRDTNLILSILMHSFIYTMTDLEVHSGCLQRSLLNTRAGAESREIAQVAKASDIAKRYCRDLILIANGGIQRPMIGSKQLLCCSNACHHCIDFALACLLRK
jgi:hypothetical protein